MGAAGLLLLALPLAGWQQRDPSLAAATTARETASITGTVVAAGPGSRPIAGAIVTVSGEPLTIGRSAITASDGSFVIATLPAGRFVLSARKPPFLPAVYAVTGSNGADTRIAVAEGQAVKDIRLVLTPGAVIAGVVRDGHGTPIQNAVVSATSLPLRSARPQADVTTRSDDRGEYRLFALAPGSYVISAAATESPFLRQVTALSSAQVTDALAALAAGRAPEAADGTLGTDVENAPIFYPGAVNPEEAMPIAVGAGEFRAAIDIVVEPVRSASISGVVMDEAGFAQQAQLSIEVKNVRVPALAGASPSARSSADGRFVFAGVRAGSYAIYARQGDKAWGESPITIDGEDMGNVDVVLHPAGRLRGTIIFPAGNVSVPALDALAVSVISSTDVAFTRAAQADVGIPSGYRPRSVSVRPDGSFDVTGLAPGSYRFSVEPLPAGWVLRSVTAGSLDVTNGFIITPQSLASPLPDVQLMIAERRGAKGQR